MRAAPRILLGIILITVFLVISSFYKQRNVQRIEALIQGGHYPETCNPSKKHPIDQLIADAATQHIRRVENERTNRLRDGVVKYRERRNRHPPPGFDEWYKNAQHHGAVILEEFFDQIHRDIEPLWGVEAATLRSLVAGWPMVIKVRNGNVTEVPNRLLRTTVWAEMIAEVANMLPDIDIPINHLDEARVIAPFRIIENAMSVAADQRKRMMKTPFDMFRYDLKAISSRESWSQTPRTGSWSKDLRQLHKAMQDSCPSASPFAQADLFNLIPRPEEDDYWVANMTLAKDICTAPEMINRHGALVEPATIDFTTTFMPLFTGSKLPIYNDIVIPEPSYYSEKAEFTGKDIWGDWSTYYPWRSKRHSLIWRGSATGGGIHDNNWLYFHRHRLIRHLNASDNDNIHIPQDRWDPYTEFNRWLSSTADAGFTKLYCDDAHDAKACPDMGSHFSLVNRVKMGQQYKYKYLPDVDGNSVSERFRAFLLSNSAPIKATIFDDWHDYRLFAWKHYIPLHISYRELYVKMIYFLGFADMCSHDKEGQTIADEGRLWAEKVLRKKDMVIYLHRVLLEYARVMHDDRDTLGYVADLLGDTID